MAVQFPEDLIDPQLKNEEWTVALGESILEEWEALDIDSFAKGADRYRENREYSIGKNSVEEHKDAFRKDNDPSTTWTKP